MEKETREQKWEAYLKKQSAETDKVKRTNQIARHIYQTCLIHVPSDDELRSKYNRYRSRGHQEDLVWNKIQQVLEHYLENTWLFGEEICDGSLMQHWHGVSLNRIEGRVMAAKEYVQIRDFSMEGLIRGIINKTYLKKYLYIPNKD